MTGEMRCSLEQIARDHPSMPLPRYTPTIIFACPECHGDLQDEGRFSYYCPACQRTYPPAQVATFDETDYERD